ncbi:hypothetical protein CAEBREN_20006 [Caenorhabditis brenneri]|uniref:Uncharacterized protein n=1 Tax=Caenorhabditis brenneri TaxID=135651 RepID=G0NQ68_CAEBE|nr:hypothetical protein CAEBREN_20006 [Caenorhabditis brenneri]
MKIFSGVFLLIVSSCYAVESRDSRPINTPSTSEMSKDAQIDMILVYNKFRQFFGEITQVGNMHQLRYYPELEATARRVRTCQHQNHGANYRIIFFPTDENKKFSSSFKEYQESRIKNPTKNLDKALKSLSESLMDIYVSDPITSELLNPLQTRIGCAYFSKPCILGPSTKFLLGEGFPKGVCALGPLGTGYAKGKSGALGSQCLGEKTINELCIEKEITGVSNVAGWWMITLWFTLLMSL